MPKPSGQASSVMRRSGRLFEKKNARVNECVSDAPYPYLGSRRPLN
jgi:hypothetical protein